VCTSICSQRYVTGDFDAWINVAIRHRRLRQHNTHQGDVIIAGRELMKQWHNKRSYNWNVPSDCQHVPAATWIRNHSSPGDAMGKDFVKAIIEIGVERCVISTGLNSFGRTLNWGLKQWDTRNRTQIAFLRESELAHFATPNAIWWSSQSIQQKFM
jgi:hypothetical protein